MSTLVYYRVEVRTWYNKSTLIRYACNFSLCTLLYGSHLWPFVLVRTRNHTCGCVPRGFIGRWVTQWTVPDAGGLSSWRRFIEKKRRGSVGCALRHFVPRYFVMTEYIINTTKRTKLKLIFNLSVRLCVLSSLCYTVWFQLMFYVCCIPPMNKRMNNCGKGKRERKRMVGEYQTWRLN